MVVYKVPILHLVSSDARQNGTYDAKCLFYILSRLTPVKMGHMMQKHSVCHFLKNHKYLEVAQ